MNGDGSPGGMTDWIAVTPVGTRVLLEIRDHNRIGLLLLLWGAGARRLVENRRTLSATRLVENRRTLMVYEHMGMGILSLLVKEL